MNNSREMTPRELRLQQWRDSHRGPYSCDSLIPNPPCSRCARTLNIFAQWGKSEVTEHAKFPSRVMKVDLCPSCMDDFIEWYDK